MDFAAIQNHFFPSTKISFSCPLTKPLSVTIETDRLKIQSVTAGDISDYAALFGDAVVMQKYATGETKDLAYVNKRISTWTARWENHDPYSGLCIRDKTTNQFIGHIVLGYGDRPGQSEFAVALKKEFWGKGYGTEAAAAVIQNYSAELMARGYLLEGQPLEEINATSRVDLIAGNKILSQVMGDPVRQEEKYGALRNHYSLKLSQKDSQGNSSLIANVFNTFKSFLETSCDTFKSFVRTS